MYVYAHMMDGHNSHMCRHQDEKFMIQFYCRGWTDGSKKINKINNNKK
jgi:hypothetical protein